MSSCCCHSLCYVFFFFNDPATTEIYTLSLHDALPISLGRSPLLKDLLAAKELVAPFKSTADPARAYFAITSRGAAGRSEEHTSELQSRRDLVCRLLLEKKKNKQTHKYQSTYYQSHYIH